MARRITEGDPFTLGVRWDGTGVNVAIYSANATGVEFCVFDGDGPDMRETRIALPYVNHGVWHAHVTDVLPGQQYGFRVHGPYEPAHGQRFNPHKLLLDPYALSIDGSIDWSAPVFGYVPGSPQLDLSCDARDSAGGVPRSVVVDPAFDWGDDCLLYTPWNETVIYEVHVKGFTIRHPDIPPELRGTYAGFAHPAAIEHLQRLGVTAVELLPIHEILDEPHLARRGLRNYWGYNTIGFFAPSARYSAAGSRGEQVAEFKSMVKALHAAGIEVILDVVYNHTAEGNEFGPTVCFRGIDNSTYYRLAPGRERYYVDYTGTGNSLNVGHPQVLKLIMDSLRYWVLDMHVDGFRFDLAATLAREFHDVDRLAAFFDIIHQDPVLARVKLIAEPWDLGEGGYQVGNFPPIWTEWNAEYRDAVRRYWRGDDGQIAALALRLTGSSDLYADDKRGPLASINFVTAHDGFTLADLVSYNQKHNEANGEGNRDGADENYSSNYGVEGPTDDPTILETRNRQVRNLLATLLFSQGVPMLLGGDEIGRTQRGNNNAYCQDNEVSWFDWNLTDEQRELLAFVSGLTALRRKHPNLRRRRFFRGSHLNGSTLKDITWLRPDGAEMTPGDWNTPWVRSLGAMLDGSGFDELDRDGNPVSDATLLLLTNANVDAIPFALPAFGPPCWAIEVDTREWRTPAGSRYAAGDDVEVAGRSLVLLRAWTDEGAGA